MRLFVFLSKDIRQYVYAIKSFDQWLSGFDSHTMESSRWRYFYASPSFIKLMTGLTMTLPTALLQKPLLKPLLSPEEIDALLYGIFPTAECSSDLAMAVSKETTAEFHADISLQNTCHKVPLSALACLN